MRVLCALGKHLYGNPQRGLGVEYSAFLPALERLGHEAFHFEISDRSKYGSFAELNRALLLEVDRLKPDILLAVPMNYEIWTETLDLLRVRGDVATVCWTTDDTWKYREVSRFVGPHFHGITTTYCDVVERYHKDGIKNVLLSQWAVNQDWLNAPLRAEQCQHQVTFIGDAHGDRAQRIRNLRDAGIDVTCFGHGWPNGPIPVSDLPRIMRDSVISLGFSNVPPHKIGPKQVKARTFEVPGSGGFLLVEHAPGIELAYEVGAEIAVFHDDRDLAEKIRYYLSHAQERDRIALAGHERTRRDHTYERRMDEVLRFAKQARLNCSDAHAPRRAFEIAEKEHRLTPALKALRQLLVSVGRLCFGELRGPRAARRLVFETSWRLAGAHTFSSRGWPGRMFPEDNG